MYTYPTNRLPVFLGAARKGNFVILVVRGDNIQKNSTAFKNLNLTAAFVLVGKSGNTSVWIDLKKPGLFLFVRIEIYSDDLDERLLVNRVKSIIHSDRPCTRDRALPRL